MHVRGILSVAYSSYEEIMLALLNILRGKLFLSRFVGSWYRQADICLGDDKRAFVHYFIGVKCAVLKCLGIAPYIVILRIALVFFFNCAPPSIRACGNLGTNSRCPRSTTIKSLHSWSFVGYLSRDHNRINKLLRKVALSAIDPQIIGESRTEFMLLVLHDVMW